MFLLTVSSFSIVRAQTETAAPAGVPAKQTADENRPNLFNELGLTPEQRQQIRRINLEKRKLAQDARARLDEANRNLDRAIYADNLNETEIQSRIREVHQAQAELLKIRSGNEIAVRKILTAEQFAKFRNLRDRFEQQLRNNPMRVQNNPMRTAKNPNQNGNQRFRIRPRRMRRN